MELSLEAIDGETHKNDDYWKSFGIPVGCGLGLSFISFLMLTVLTIQDLPILVLIFLSSFFHLGHLAIWPLLSIFFIVRASASGNTSSKNGAVRSLKLYALWVVIVVTPMAYVAVTFNGIV
ncbi:MAG: hypothetical protein DWC10_00630 [Candidatus Poseidoniales archaeon]|nr:MAG: hypothetical protein DWC10_00630 [Candidatus Poseidoniales archaeon]